MYDRGVECYIDDIIIYADTEQEILSLLEELFIKLDKANFKLHPEKCEFFKETVNVLGHTVSGASVFPKEKKVLKLIKDEPPKSKK